MKFIPAIYIQKGKVVSLYKGNDNEQKKSYPKSPQSYAEWFAKQGVDTLFIVDLDGDQHERLNEIRAVFPGEIWWAGRVRDVELIRELMANGADRVVLGQSAEPIFASALSEFGPERLIAGLQVKHTDQGPDLCESLGGKGFTDVLVKDLNAEGTLFMPSFDLFEKCVYFSNMNVYASGGVSEERHIELLQRVGVKGVIIARAFFENQLSFERLRARFSD